MECTLAFRRMPILTRLCFGFAVSVYEWCRTRWYNGTWFVELFWPCIPECLTEISPLIWMVDRDFSCWLPRLFLSSVLIFNVGLLVPLEYFSHEITFYRAIATLSRCRSLKSCVSTDGPRPTPASSPPSSLITMLSIRVYKDLLSFENKSQLLHPQILKLIALLTVIANFDAPATSYPAQFYLYPYILSLDFVVLFLGATRATPHACSSLQHLCRVPRADHEWNASIKWQLQLPNWAAAWAKWISEEKHVWRCEASLPDWTGHGSRAWARSWTWPAPSREREWDGERPAAREIEWM